MGLVLAQGCRAEEDPVGGGGDSRDQEGSMPSHGGIPTPGSSHLYPRLPWFLQLPSSLDPTSYLPRFCCV